MRKKKNAMEKCIKDMNVDFISQKKKQMEKVRTVCVCTCVHECACCMRVLCY